MAVADPGPRPTSYSLRAVLIAYSFAVVLPVLILAGYLLNELAAADRAALEQRMVQMADALREDIDREIERRITMLTVLATSPALEQSDYATFTGTPARRSRRTRSSAWSTPPCSNW